MGVDVADLPYQPLSFGKKTPGPVFRKFTYCNINAYLFSWLASSKLAYWSQVSRVFKVLYVVFRLA